jgi:hypothetical protein
MAIGFHPHQDAAPVPVHSQNGAGLQAQEAVRYAQVMVSEILPPAASTARVRRVACTQTTLSRSSASLAPHRRARYLK